MAVVVPIALIAERRVVAYFLNAGAVGMADAVPYSSTHPARRRAFERLKGRDIVKTSGNDKWWLDEEAWAQRRSDRRTKAIFALLAVGVAAAVAALR